jgi:hypothetical protein
MVNAFFEVHKDLPREGPGDNESTKKAYLMLRNLPEKSRILDNRLRSRNADDRVGETFRWTHRSAG